MKIPVLSYSFVSMYKRCPKQAYHTYVVKDIKRVETEAMRYGNEVHSALENAIKTSEPLPEDLAQAQPFLAALGPGCHAELQLAMNDNGGPCDYWGTSVLFRGKLDVFKTEGNRALIVDWKTGKTREDPTELEYHAMLALVHNPDLSSIDGMYVWLKTDKLGKRYKLINKARDLVSETIRLKKELDACLIEERWPARPTPLCGWCPVSTCQFNLKV